MPVIKDISYFEELGEPFASAARPIFAEVKRENANLRKLCADAPAMLADDEAGLARARLLIEPASTVLIAGLAMASMFKQAVKDDEVCDAMVHAADSLVAASMSALIELWAKDKAEHTRALAALQVLAEQCLGRVEAMYQLEKKAHAIANMADAVGASKRKRGRGN